MATKTKKSVQIAPKQILKHQNFRLRRDIVYFNTNKCIDFSEIRRPNRGDFFGGRGRGVKIYVDHSYAQNMLSRIFRGGINDRPGINVSARFGSSLILLMSSQDFRISEKK